MVKVTRQEAVDAFKESPQTIKCLFSNTLMCKVKTGGVLQIINGQYNYYSEEQAEKKLDLDVIFDKTSKLYVPSMVEEYAFGKLVS